MSKEIPCQKCGHVWLWANWKKPEDAYCPEGHGCNPSAKQRIEKLEAKLEKAVEALVFSYDTLEEINPRSHTYDPTACHDKKLIEVIVNLSNTLAELKGQDDE